MQNEWQELELNPGGAQAELMNEMPFLALKESESELLFQAEKSS
jgi:hypothetical protein